MFGSGGPLGGVSAKCTLFGLYVVISAFDLVSRCGLSHWMLMPLMFMLWMPKGPCLTEIEGLHRL